MYAGQTIRLAPELEGFLLLEGDSAIERERIATLIAQLRESAARRSELRLPERVAPLNCATVAQ